MHTVEAQKWSRDLGLVESVDRELGDELQKQSNPALLVHLGDLLQYAESELKCRDRELAKNIDIINELYASCRYRIGRFLIKPIEMIAIRLGMLPKPTPDPRNLITQNVGT